MKRSLEVTYTPDGETAHFTLVYHATDLQCILEVHEECMGGVEPITVRFTHQDLTDFINTLMLVREQVDQ